MLDCMRSRSILSALLFVVGASVPLHIGAQAGVQASEHLRNGIAAQQRGDMRAAIEEYRKALALKADLPEAHANLGAALAAVGDFNGAIEEDRRALVNAPDPTAVRMNLALAYYKKGDWPNAKKEFSTVHANRPSDLNAAMLLGYCDIKSGRPLEALDLLQPLEARALSNMDFQFVLAYALIESGRETEGLPRMEKMAGATNSIDAWVIAGTTRLHRREFHEARTDLEAAEKVAPNFPGLQSMLGQARDALGDTDEAAKAFQAALRQNPRDFTANLYLGAIRLKQHDFETARPLLELALQLDPTMPQAVLQMAKLNAMTGKPEEAAAALEQLEKADPNWLDPHVELAALYYRLHRQEDGQREREIVNRLEAKQRQDSPRNQ